MITEVMKKESRRCLDPYLHPRSVNLYKFIRLVLGAKISNREIASRWGMDEKNFHEFRMGRTPVPRIERLETLARMLGVHPAHKAGEKCGDSNSGVMCGVNKHLVFEVALGASANKVFRLIRKNDLPACRALLGVGGPGQRSDSGVPPQRG